MQYAWIESGRIRDVVSCDPAALFHPDIAKCYDTEVPDEAANGDGWVDGQWVKSERTAPAVDLEPLAPTPPKVSPVEFKLLFTPAERVAIKAARATDPVIDDFFEIVEDPRLSHVNLGLQSTQDALAYLETKGLITAERRIQILAGQVQ